MESEIAAAGEPSIPLKARPIGPATKKPPAARPIRIFRTGTPAGGNSPESPSFRWRVYLRATGTNSTTKREDRSPKATQIAAVSKNQIACVILRISRPLVSDGRGAAVQYAQISPHPTSES